MSKRLPVLINAFKIPLLVLGGLILYLLLSFFHLSMPALIVVLGTIALGSFGLFKETFEDILANQFALDYIAIMAIVVSLVTHEYLVGAVIALMLSSGRTLEEYGANQAKRSLSMLADRIPHDVLVEENNTSHILPLKDIRVNQTIIVRKGEVIPLDGELLSKKALIDESSLTGEPYPVDKLETDTMRSGTINVGDSIKICVTKEEGNSTYNKIIRMVETAEKEKAPMVRLADRYSIVFTVITFAIAFFAFALHRNLDSVLAVLVVATPCPLILATPIALLGGVNAAAKKRIIVKKLASIEALSRVSMIIFDKTGTITLGKPKVTEFTLVSKHYEAKQVLGISEAIERNSLHPLAKAIVLYAKEQHAPLLHADNVKEVIGQGIFGEITGKNYLLSKIPNHESGNMVIGIYENKTLLATFSLEDQMKTESTRIIKQLKNSGLAIAMFTGDKLAVAKKVAEHLHIPIEIRAELKPEDKQQGILALKKQGKVTAMVGDGINDAPALALADVGMVFSNEEQTAASEAADIVFLGGDFAHV
ncbi:MAG: cadmium-translocating P-type ATPase, partial [Patescibacteria group bacterium]|nr:cadmium-translocating P-type ATPase [Patescibacteria group bacterium]